MVRAYRRCSASRDGPRRSTNSSHSERFGLKLMSIGFLLDDREGHRVAGPMLHGALVQFLRDVNWGQLDFLILDLPGHEATSR